MNIAAKNVKKFILAPMAMGLALSSTGCLIGGKDAADGGGGGSAGVSIPTVTTTCNASASAACTSGLGNNGDAVISAFFKDKTCDDLTNPEAQASNTNTCAVANCNGTVVGNWTDKDDAAITKIATGSYAVAMIFDFNNNFVANGSEPDTGDVVCCKSVTVTSTTSVSMTDTDCTQL